MPPKIQGVKGKNGHRERAKTAVLLGFARVYRL
jgi:hypothetical protein